MAAVVVGRMAVPAATLAWKQEEVVVAAVEARTAVCWAAVYRVVVEVVAVDWVGS